MAITAFDSQAIQNAGIERPGDFIALTPNVTLVEAQNAGNAFVIIRGITQNRTSEPSVAVIVDGVQQVNPAQFNQDLFDIEQIEVLKGPQGGLYGRNAIGGAIIITTKKPTDEFSGNITAGIDNGFGYFLRGGITGPLAENVKFRIAGSWYDTEGFIPNTFLGEDVDPVEDFSLRANLLVEASDRLAFDLRGSLNQLRTQGLYYNIVGDVNTVAPGRVNNPGQNDRDIYNLALRIEYAGDNAPFTSVSSYDTLEEILTGDAFDFLPVVPGVPQVQSGEVRTAVFDDWQPKLTLTWTPDPDLTIYGGYSRGFRSGGFNQTGVGAEAINNNIVSVGDIFRAETADTFEIGAKGRIGPVRLAGAAYTTLSKNSYFFVFLAQSSTQNRGNIPKTRINGFELEASARRAPHFDVNAAIGVTDGEIKEFPDPTVIGNEAPQISRYTLNLGAQYSGPLSGDVDGLLRIDYRRTGRTWWEPFNTTVRQPVDVVDARAGVTIGGVSITAFAQNLFDETYNAEFSPGGFVFRARPRRFGVEVGYRFYAEQDDDQGAGALLFELWPYRGDGRRRGRGRSERPRH